jgi:hypothetical protein
MPLEWKDNEKKFTQITQKINEAYNYFKKHNKNV